MNPIYRAFLGYERLTFSSKEPERILNFALSYNVPVWEIAREGESVSFSVSRLSLRFFRSFEKNLRKGETLSRKKRGSLRFVQLFGKRIGFYLGLLFFFSVLLFSTNFIWSVQVKGNESYTENEIRQKLAKIGIAPGTWKKDVDTLDSSLRFQVENPEFSFLSVNLIGTVAFVEVRERETIEKEKEEEILSNQVAKTAGKIVRYEVLSGQIEVKVGESVPKGSLLISGVRENKSGTFSALRARGRVFAETVRRFKETIPFEQTETVYTGRETVENSYEILGFTLGKSGAAESPYTSFETMEFSEDVTFFQWELPIVRKSLVFAETEEKNEVLTVDRARILAYDKYEEYKRGTFASDTSITEENVTFSQDENGVTIEVEILAVEDICEEKPFLCNHSYF